MTVKEIGEVRRQLKPEKSNITTVYGRYVGQTGEPIADFAQSVGLMGEEEREFYHALLKKLLSGGQGKTLFDLSFPTREVAEGSFHRRLMDLLGCKCQQEEAREALYRQIMSSVKPESNYVILLACNVYDVPHKRSDGERDMDGSESVYTHLLCAVCPVKQAKPGLGYHREEKTFHTSVGDYLIAPPQWGFLFPAFDDRATNLYNALCYLRKGDEDGADFVAGVFGQDCPPSAESRRAAFAGLLEEAQCGLEAVNTISQRVRELEEAHKSEGRQEDFAVSGDELRLMLDECGVSEERLDAFSQAFARQFEDTADPAQLMDMKHCQVTLPEITIKATPEAAQRMETRTIDGVNYLLIRPEGEVQVNGVTIAFQTEGE